MKFKNVFLIWLWADIILAVGLITGNAIYKLYSGKSLQNINFNSDVFAVIGIGFMLTLPSLLIMLVFHAIFSREKNDYFEYKKPYLLLIIIINVLYLIVCIFSIGIRYSGAEEFGAISLGFLCTTIAGLLAFLIEHKRIQRRINL